MSEAMETSIEQTMQERYSAARERLGRPFVPKRVVVPRSAVPAALLPSWPIDKPEPEPFKQSRKMPADGAKRVTSNMIWATQTVPVTVASFGEWGDDNLVENITIINSRWRMIMKEVCAKHKVGVLEIRSHRRSYPIIRARHELFYRLRTETALSFAQIGQRVGGFDHSTTISGIRCHIKRLEEGTAL